MCQALFLALGIQQWTQAFLPSSMWAIQGRVDRWGAVDPSVQSSLGWGSPGQQHSLKGLQGQAGIASDSHRLEEPWAPKAVSWFLAPAVCS